MSRKIESSPGAPVPQPPDTQEQKTAEAKLAAFFEDNREFFTLYAGDASVSVKPSREAGTFAIDLEHGVLLGDPSYYEKKGLREAHAFNSFLHEFEHFRRLMELIRDRDGLVKWKAHRARMRKKPHLHIFDNVLEDISVDRAILARAPNQEDTQMDLYRTHLWPKRDFSELPKHLQFLYALFRERMIHNEPVEVSEDVRAEIAALREVKNHSGQDVIEVMSHPDLPQAKRLALQKMFFEPVYERLFKEDVERKQEEKRKEQEGKAGEGAQQDGQEGDGESQDQDLNEQQGKGQKPGEQQGTQPSPADGDQTDPQGAGEPGDPDAMFEALYKEYWDKSPDAAITDEQIQEAVDAVLGQGKKKSPEELAQEAYAKEAGVSVQDLRAYQRFWESVEDLRDPESDESVVEQIREAFRRIVTERLDLALHTKQPVEEGEYLIRPAQAVAEIHAGNMEPRVWMTHERRERPKELFGAFDVTLVCDRSGSMEGADGEAIKKIEQQKAAALMLEALREFCDDLDEERSDLIADLQVRSEVWGFGDASEVGVLKALSEDLTDRERVAVFKELSSVPGQSTRDDLALEGILATLDEEDVERIARGELRKVVIVLTDGGSSNEKGAKAAMKKLRDKGVSVVAIGITGAAQAALTLYGSDARLAKTAADTGVAVGEVLTEFIQGLNGSKT